MSDQLKCGWKTIRLVGAEEEARSCRDTIPKEEGLGLGKGASLEHSRSVLVRKWWIGQDLETGLLGVPGSS